jgi:hypothetical protein
MPLTAITCLATYCFYLNEFQYSLCFAIAAFLIVFTTAVTETGRTRALHLIMTILYTIPVGYLMTIV